MQLLKGGLATMKAKMERPGFYENALGLMARYTDTNLGPVELYRLGRTVTEVDPGKVRGLRARRRDRLGGRGQHRGPELCRGPRPRRDVRHDAKVDRGC